MRNIIDAIETIVRTHNYTTADVANYQIKINAVGEGLEDYIKDAFADSFSKDAVTRERLWKQEFSHLGSLNNPPDIMIKDGDAIEVKKQEGFSAIPLNSSIPHQKLKSTDSRINEECRNAEVWDEKDLIYAVGYIKSRKINHLSLVYGLDYCAKEETYDRLWKPIKAAIDKLGKELKDVRQVETNELGKFKDIDPLKFGDMRVRGMYNLKNPIEAFKNVYTRPTNKAFTLLAIINKGKLATFANADKLDELKRTIPHFSYSDKNVPNPDDPTQTQEVRVITYYE